MQKKDRSDRPASAARGTQNTRQKSESYFLNKRSKTTEPRREGGRAIGAVAFPASGSIYFSHWRDLVREHSTGVTPDADIVANAFRKFCSEKNIPLDAPKIEERFIKIVQRFRI
jgi:replication initiation protein RepC